MNVHDRLLTKLDLVNKYLPSIAQGYMREIVAMVETLKDESRARQDFLCNEKYPHNVD